MSEKQNHSSVGDMQGCSSRFVCLASLVCLLICTTALVRVEIINQRVLRVEDVVAEVRQTYDSIKDTNDASNSRNSKRLESVGEPGYHIFKEGQGAMKARIDRVRRFSAESGAKPEQITMVTIRKEINKTLHSLSPLSFCSPREKICVQGPPGMQGVKGSRGRRGPRGAQGRKGSRGIRGEPGTYGKQGKVGPPGQRGEQGFKGVPGPRGPPGAKGEPGESLSSPVVVVSPSKQTVKENQSVVFQCSARGNPKPTASWLRSNASAWSSRFISGSDGKLEMHEASLKDAGKFICVARNILGSANKSAVLTVEAPPRVQLVQGPTHVKTGQSITLPRCHVTGFPKPLVTWTRSLDSLPKARITFAEEKEVITFALAEKQDTGSYICTATNSLGRASAVTTLVVWSAPRFVMKPPSSVIKNVGESLSLSCSANGDPTPLVSWKRATGAWVEARMKVLNGTLTISGLVDADTGTYVCEAKIPHFVLEARAHVKVKQVVDCPSYSSLTSADRKTTYTTGSAKCDKTISGWYRFQGAAGTKMPTTCPPTKMCGTLATGWLNGVHPTVAEGQVTRQVCFHWSSNCCKWSTNIQVRNCGSYYVYNLSGTPTCRLRYCSTD